MPKRKHDLNESTFSEPGSKRLRTETNGDINGFVETNDEPVIEYWLVRKPKSLKADDIPVIKVPNNIPDEGREKVKSGYNFRFTQARQQMFVIDRELRKKKNNQTEHKPVGMIKGLISVEPPKSTELEDTGPLPPEEDYMRPFDVPEISEFTFEIPSIRKQVPPVDDVVERLTAFGVVKNVRKEKKKKKKH